MELRGPRAAGMFDCGCRQQFVPPSSVPMQQIKNLIPPKKGKALSNKTWVRPAVHSKGRHPCPQGETPCHAKLPGPGYKLLASL